LYIFIVAERVSQELGLSSNNMRLKLPSLKEFISDDEDSEYVSGDDIWEYLVSNTSYGDPSFNILSKAGIEMDFFTLEPDTLERFIEASREAAAENGIDNVAMNAGIDLLGQTVFGDVYTHFPKSIENIILFIEENRFFADDITYFSSARVGRFIKNQEILKEYLSIDLWNGIQFLIASVFEPLYIRFVDLDVLGLNSKGEYCSLCTCGYFEESDETVLQVHKRPYAELAVALLDRFLSEAEQLAADILLVAEKVAA